MSAELIGFWARERMPRLQTMASLRTICAKSQSAIPNGRTRTKWGRQTNIGGKRRSAQTVFQGDLIHTEPSYFPRWYDLHTGTNVLWIAVCPSMVNAEQAIPYPLVGSLRSGLGISCDEECIVKVECP